MSADGRHRPAERCRRRLADLHVAPLRATGVSTRRPPVGSPAPKALGATGRTRRSGLSPSCQDDTNQSWDLCQGDTKVVSAA
jgi:hypothetical protein